MQQGMNEPVVLYNVACFYPGLGETERAIDLLEQAVSLGWGDRAWMENDSDLEPLRDEPRFGRCWRGSAELPRKRRYDLSAIRPAGTTARCCLRGACTKQTFRAVQDVR